MFVVATTVADWHAGDGRDGDGERAADEPDMTMLNAEKKREDGLRAGGEATSGGALTK